MSQENNTQHDMWRYAQEAQEMRRFRLTMQMRGNYVTFGLIAFITLLFMLENLWGGADYVPTIYRMGANSYEAVTAGQYWRLLTSVFLHGGFLHAAFNLYVLYIMGPFFNRILGEARFFSLFVLSGLCGSVASVWIGKVPLSLGASGAIWGIFGLSAALTFRPSPYLPDSLRLSIRRMTLINIAINLALSLLPMIDIWAHIGGGLGGFLMGFFFMRLGPLKSRFLAFVLAGLVFWSFGHAFLTQQPWEVPITREQSQKLSLNSEEESVN